MLARYRGRRRRPQVFGAPATWGSGHLLALPHKSDAARREAALTFVSWLVKNSAAWASSGNIPALLAARQTDAFRPLPGRNAFVASLSHVVFPPD